MDKKNNHNFTLRKFVYLGVYMYLTWIKWAFGYSILEKLALLYNLRVYMYKYSLL